MPQLVVETIYVPVPGPLGTVTYQRREIYRLDGRVDGEAKSAPPDPIQPANAR